MAGKGSRYRKVDRAKYDANYERIFGKRRRKPKATLRLPDGTRLNLDIIDREPMRLA